MRRPILPLPPSMSRPSCAIPRSSPSTISGRTEACPCSRRACATEARWQGQASLMSASGACSLRIAIRSASNRDAASNLFGEAFSTRTCTKMVMFVSSFAIPRASRSAKALRTPDTVSPLTPQSSSVVMPSSCGALMICCTMAARSSRRRSVISADARISRTSCMLLTRSEAGNTCTRFSSRFRSRASSSQATAVFTRVSSVLLSRWKSRSFSS